MAQESAKAEVELVLDEVRELQSRLENERSLVTLTYAQALDGSIAAGRGGSPLQLSNSATMYMTHRLRASHDGIMVGINTVISDDPSLTTRLCPGASPRPIVLDSGLRCPPQAKLIQLRKKAGEAGPIIVYQDKRLKCDDPSKHAEKELRRANLEAEGAIAVPAMRGDWKSLFATLKRDYGIKRVMVEGGARVIRSMLTEGRDVVDNVVVTIAPLFVGGLVPSQPWDGAYEHTRLEVKRCVIVEGDVILCGHIART